MTSQITIILPNAHRQIIKVLPNTTLIQVLQEVCLKQNLNSEQYTLS